MPRCLRVWTMCCCAIKNEDKETLTELLRAYIAALPEALILLTSHDAGLLSRLCTRHLVMEGGRLSTASDR